MSAVLHSPALDAQPCQLLSGYRSDTANRWSVVRQCQVTEYVSSSPLSSSRCPACLMPSSQTGHHQNVASSAQFSHALQVG